MPADQGKENNLPKRRKAPAKRSSKASNRSNKGRTGPGRAGGSGAKQEPPGFQMGRALRTSLGWMAIVLVAFLLASVFSSGSSSKQVGAIY